MPKYYWETPSRSGQIELDDDKQARKYCEMMGSSLICMYRESDSEDVTPFVMVWEKRDDLH